MFKAINVTLQQWAIEVDHRQIHYHLSYQLLLYIGSSDSTAADDVEPDRINK
jgi:hypothetical protein